MQFMNNNKISLFHIGQAKMGEENLIEQFVALGMR